MVLSPPALMTAVLRMCEPVMTPWPPTPAIRMLKRFAMMQPPFLGLGLAGNCGGSSGLREELLVAVPLGQILFGFITDVFRERVAVVLNGLRIFHDLIGRDRILDVAGGIGLNVGGADFTGNQHCLLDDALDTAWIVGYDSCDVGASGNLRHLQHVHLLKLLAERRHLQHGTAVGHTALLSAGIAVHFAVQHDSRKALFPEPGVKDLLEANVGRSAVPGHHDHVLRLVSKPKPEAAGKSARHAVLVTVVAVDKRDGGLRTRQTASG